MCLLKTHAFPKISRKPIKVWKIVRVVNKYLCAPIMGSVYNSNTIKCNSIFPIIAGTLKTTIEEEGVHAYIFKSSAIKCLDFNEKVIEAEIPPFTPYWIGEFNEIAATKMILKPNN